MIKLGKLTDYAIVLMGQLAKEGMDAARSAHYLSDKTGVPGPTVAKVLKKLAKENFVVSLRGTAGGYKLSRAADQISIEEIIAALDGPIAVVSCVNNTHSDCKSQSACPVRGSWDRVNDVIKGALEEVKLTEMVMPSCGKTHNFMQDIN